MTVFEPVLAAWNVCQFFIACKIKLVYSSSCVDCSSATSTHSSAVILKEVSSHVTYNALPCSISLSLQSPSNNLMRLVLLKELPRNCLHCCMLCTPARHLYCRVVLARRFRLSESLTDSWRHTSKTTSTLPLYLPTYSTMDKTDSAT